MNPPSHVSSCFPDFIPTIPDLFIMAGITDSITAKQCHAYLPLTTDVNNFRRTDCIAFNTSPNHPSSPLSFEDYLSLDDDYKKKYLAFIEDVKMRLIAWRTSTSRFPPASPLQLPDLQLPDLQLHFTKAIKALQSVGERADAIKQFVEGFEDITLADDVAWKLLSSKLVKDKLVKDDDDDETDLVKTRVISLGKHSLLHIPRIRNIPPNFSSLNRYDQKNLHSTSLRSRLKNEDLAKVGELIGGTKTAGLSFIAASIAHMDVEAHNIGCGIAKVRPAGPCNVISALVMMKKANLCENQIMEMNGVATVLDGGPIFPSIHEIRAYRLDSTKHLPKQIFDVKPIMVKNPDTGKYEEHLIDTWTIKLEEAATAESLKQKNARIALHKMSLHKLIESRSRKVRFGIVFRHNRQRNRKEKIISVGGDHGNSEQRVGFTMVTQEGQGQDQMVQLVSAVGKESWELMKETCALVAAGIRNIRQTKAIYVYTKTGDAVFVNVPLATRIIKDKKDFTDNFQSSDFAVGSEFVYDTEKENIVGLKVGEVQYKFEGGEMIAADLQNVEAIETCYYRVILSGDLLYFATIQGRAGASTAWCLYCNKKRADWQDEEGAGEAWTTENSKAFRADIFKKCENDLLDPEQRDRICKKLGVKRCGFRCQEDPIFDIDLDDYVIPCLHIMLGVVKDVFDRMEHEIITTIQVVVKKVFDARVRAFIGTTNVDKAYDTKDKAEEAFETVEKSNNDFIKKSTKEVADLTKQVETLKVKLASSQYKGSWPGMKQDVASAETKIKALDVKIKKTENLTKESKEAFEAIEEKYKAAKKESTAANKALKEVLDKSPPGACELALIRVLAEFKISREVYFGGSFIGPCCKRLMTNNRAIFARLRTELLAHKREGLDDKVINDLIWKYQSLFGELDICCSIMRSTDQQSDGAIEQYKESAKRFGKMWREYFPDDVRVSPKVHLLESHVYDQLLRFGTLGLFSEDPIERLHHQHLVATRRICNLREYVKRETYLYSRKAAFETKEVVQTFAAAEGRKRKWSAATLLKIELKQTEDDKELGIKIQTHMDFLGSKSNPIIM